MEDVLENKILQELYETRKTKFETNFVKKMGSIKEIQASQKMEENLNNILKRTIKNADELEKVLDSFEDFKMAEIEELGFWNEQFYRLGFMDAIKLKSELQNTKSKFIEEFLEQYIEEMRYNYWYKISDYKKLLEEISNIKNKYPNVLNFFENDEICELSIDELNAIHKIIGLNKHIEELEKIELFKCGIKEFSLL